MNHNLGFSTQHCEQKVVIAIPCFRNRPYIRDIVSRASKYIEQVIVIDDGSDDGTAEAAKAAGALVVNHATNRGYGEAMKSCFKAAKANDADILVILDGDGQHNPDEIPQLLAPIIQGKADLVIGSRFLQPDQSTSQESRVISPPPRLGTLDSGLSTRDSQLTVMPRYRKFGIGVITLLWNLGSRTKVSDTQSGFRAYSKKMFENLSLSERGMSISIETLEKARKKGAIIKEVPISCRYVPSALHVGAIRPGLGVALSVVRIRLKSSIGANNA